MLENVNKRQCSHTQQWIIWFVHISQDLPRWPSYSARLAQQLIFSINIKVLIKTKWGQGIDSKKYYVQNLYYRYPISLA
jgi:hypothetical protein